MQRSNPIPVPIPIPMPRPAPRPVPGHMKRGMMLRASPFDDDKIGQKYCLKASVLLYSNTKSSEDPVGDVTAWDRNSDVIRMVENVADDFCEKHDLHHGDTELIFQHECEREIDDTITVRVYDENDIQV
jgi:hypothetical protein